MNVKTKVGLVFAAGMLLTFGGMAAALVYANKVLEKSKKSSSDSLDDDKINAEEPENVKCETVN